jgi:predicted DNA-binding transcriptional regulator YafY
VKLEGNHGTGGKTYSHYVIHEAAMKFIRDNAKQPFFAYLPYTPPHGNFDIPDSDPAWALYKDKPWTEPARRYAAMVTMMVRQVGELLALLVAQRALEQYRGTPFHHQLEVAFAKLSGGLRDKISFSPADELRAVSFKNIGLGKTDLTVFNALSAAVLKSTEVGFAYRKPGETKTVPRRVQPYHLANRENSWYLVGFDLERGALRTFALPRIGEVVTTAVEFERPEDFSPEKFFSSALGVLGGEGNFAVVIRFDATVAERVREREWHESQEMRELPGGALELKLRLGALVEVEQWVLGWGAAAEVIGPAEFRASVKATVARLGQMYG